MATSSPATPMMTNIERQPNATSSAVSTGGAIAGPSAEDALNSPIGNARAEAWNQFEHTLVPARYIGDSPTPSAPLAPRNCPRLPTKPATTCAADHRIRPIVITRRGPNRSISTPTGSWATP